MRHVVAVLIVAVFASVTTIDRVACADGRADATTQQGQAAPTPSICGLCHGWSRPLVSDVVGQPLLPRVRALAAAPSRELAAHLAPPDHPPRLG